MSWFRWLPRPDVRSCRISTKPRSGAASYKLKAGCAAGGCQAMAGASASIRTMAGTALGIFAVVQQRYDSDEKDRGAQNATPDAGLRDSQKQGGKPLQGARNIVE